VAALDERARLVIGNVKRVLERVKRAALSCGRDPASVRLVGAAKTAPPELVAAAIGAGLDIVGENYVKEAQGKIEALAGLPVSWHFLGHLQTNKAGLAARLFDCIHTVDSVRLAGELSRRLQAQNRVMPVLIEVNIAGEGSKWGVSPDGAPGLAESMAALPGLKVTGLMAMPPFYDDPRDSRPHFAALRELARKIDDLKIENVSMKELSMGLSRDFESAVLEGATLVRVGTAIFGSRS
jgi:pyridoxal phosphate enzyme (YggS family)